ncbi:MAG: cupin domain-containing protein [bacterium]|nr:cupin domain-containing protein [bacterium]
MGSEPDRIRILRDDENCPELPIVERGGRAWAVVWPGVGAYLRSMHRISLLPGGRTVVMEHPTEAVYYVMSGTGAVAGPDGDRRALSTGAMAHVSPGTAYLLESGENGAEIVGGPCPADPSLYAHLGTFDTVELESRPDRQPPGGIHLFHRDLPTAIVPMIARDARLVVWPGVAAYTANMNYVDMQPGERNIEHVHVESEDTIYILDGKGSIDDITNGMRLEFEAGAAIHVPVGVWHAVSGDRNDHIESVGGPCPADWNMLRVAGLVPDDTTEEQ